MKIAALIVGISLFMLTSGTAFAQYDEYVGKEVALQPYGAKGVVHLGNDKKNYNAIIGNLMSRDSDNYMTMILGHRCVEVDRNTTVRVMQVNFWEKTAQVEILDGSYKGSVGWVLLDTIIGY